MKRLSLLMTLFLALAMISCQQKMTIEKIAEIESQMLDENGFLKNDVGAQLVDAYMLYAEQNPNDEMSPNMLFKALDISVNLNAENPEKTIEIADIIIEKYPEFELAPMSLFIKGFVYENVMNDIPAAVKTYKEFLEKYPNDPMVEDVRSTMSNMGLSPEELIRKFESYESEE